VAYRARHDLDAHRDRHPYVDVQVPPEEQAPIRFTWEGMNYTVVVVE
jgi:hypothetical protein